MGALDALLGGAATVGQTALQVPQAIGGGALDILIGDRTNVPAGEQVKRSIEALLLSGDNPANLIAIHGMNAKRDAQNEAIVNSPDFRRTMSVQQTVKDLTPEEAFNATAELYGVHGYRPPMAREAVDAAPGGPSLPDRQNVPQLAPLSRQTQLKDIVQGTQLHAATQGDPLDQLLARYKLGKIDPPIGLQQDAADEALKGSAEPGASQVTRKWNGSTLSVEVQDLPPEKQFFAGRGAEERAMRARDARQEWYRSIGDPTEVGLIMNPSGTAFTLKEVMSPESAEAAKVRGKALGENTALGGGLDPAAAGKTPAQIATGRATALATREEEQKLAGQRANIRAAREQLDQLRDLTLGPLNPKTGERMGGILRTEPFGGTGSVGDIADRALYIGGQKLKTMSGNQGLENLMRGKKVLRSSMAKALGDQKGNLNIEEQKAMDEALAGPWDTGPGAAANLQVMEGLLNAKDSALQSGRVLTAPKGRATNGVDAKLNDAFLR